MAGEWAASRGLTGEEAVTVRGLAAAVADPARRRIEAQADGTSFAVRVRLDTRREAEYDRHGGVLPFVLRTVLGPPRSDGQGG